MPCALIWDSAAQHTIVITARRKKTEGTSYDEKNKVHIKQLSKKTVTLQYKDAET